MRRDSSYGVVEVPSNLMHYGMSFNFNLAMDRPQWVGLGALEYFPP